MTNDLMIPESNTLPAYIINPELVKQSNEEAAGGISTGSPPRIKLAQKAFKLVDANGEETSYPPSKLIIGSDENAYLAVIVLRARSTLNKVWYAKKFAPGDEPTQPDCFSEDALRPHSSIQNPQCDSCEACALNAYGSATDHDGKATAGKDCSDIKTLAVFVPNYGVHKFRIPGASLKNFGIFVNQLTKKNIPLSYIKTFVGFDMDVDFAKLVFRYGGPLAEKFIPKVNDLMESSEVTDIIQGNKSIAVPSNIEEAAAKKKAEEAAKKKAEEAAKKKAEEAAKKKAEEAAAKKKAEEAEEAEEAADDDMGFELDNKDSDDSKLDSISDNDLAAELGL